MQLMQTIDTKAEELAAKIDTDDLDKAMGYTLADAIREGSSVTGQCVGAWSDPDGDLCALSAALVAVKARRMI